MGAGIYFELGFLKLLPKSGDSSRSLVAEEFTFTVSTENQPRYACDIVGPIDIMPTKKKFMWSCKKPKFFETDRFFIEALYGGDFNLAVFRLISEFDMKDSKLQSIKDIEVSGGSIFDLAKTGGVPGIEVDTGTESVNSSNMTTDSTFYYSNGWYVEHVMNLHNCSIDSLEVGNFDGTKPVSETIQGVAQFFTFSKSVTGYYKKEITGGNEL